MPKILLVDDEPNNCLLLEQLLKRCSADYEVQSCYQGLKGVTTAKTWKPDLVFMDLHMPGMDGLQVIHSLRRDGFTGKIIILTADHRSENAKLGIKAGANGFLIKPIDTSTICDTASSFLGK